MSRDTRVADAAESVQEVAGAMADEGVGAMPVRERGRLVGLITERDIVMAPGFEAPSEGGVLFYFLTKRISFSVQPMEGYALRGSEYELPRFRLKLEQPMLLDPGWSLLMLEKDRWMWGVVVA